MQEKGERPSSPYSLLARVCIAYSVFMSVAVLTYILYRLSLIAGNHVHLLEPHWNPMAESQALNRVHRIGQTREVTVRRYIVKDTIENVVAFLSALLVSLVADTYLVYPVDPAGQVASN